YYKHRAQVQWDRGRRASTSHPLLQTRATKKSYQLHLEKASGSLRHVPRSWRKYGSRVRLVCRSTVGSGDCRYRRVPQHRPRPRANLVAAHAPHVRQRTPLQCPCDFPRDGEKDLPQWDCDKHYRYKRKGRFSQDAAARTLDGGQVRSHKITPTRLGFIQLIYETSVEKIALPPGAHRPADFGWPCAAFTAACRCRFGKNIRRPRLALGSLWPPHCPGES